MELTKKTTVLLPPDLHEQLTRRAEREGTSLGDLVRRACRAEYGLASKDDRRRALQELLSLDLPVGEPGEMKRQSVPKPEEILPAKDRRRRSGRKASSR